MTLGEAFAELGVEPGTDVALARRAYTRLLRTRKPETDPEGFRRLREAWERVQAGDAARDTPEPTPVAESVQPVAPGPVGRPRVTPEGTVVGVDAYAEAWERAADLAEPLPDTVSGALEVLTDILLVGSTAYARRIAPAVTRALEARGPLEVAFGEGTERWLQLAAIAAAGDAFPRDVVVLLVRALLTGEWQALEAAIRRHIRGGTGARILPALRGPLAGVRAKVGFGDGPTLPTATPYGGLPQGAPYAATLPTADPARATVRTPKASGGSPWSVLWLSFILLSALGRGVSALEEATRPPPVSSRTATAPVSTAPPQVGHAVAAAVPAAEQALQAFEVETCAGAVTGVQAACSAARVVAQDLQAGNCSGWSQLRGKIELVIDTTTVVGVAANRVESAMVAACP